ncbi:MAG: outer membrane beta-barrel protein [Gemmatimonadota bacterium]
MSGSQRFVRKSVLSVGLAAISLLCVRPAHAQGITFTPYVGSFYGISKYFDNDIDLSNFGGTGTARFTMQQNNTAMFGARLAFPIGATLSVEGAVGYLSSEVRFTGKDAAGPGVDLATSLKGNMIVGSVRGVIRPRRSNLNLIAGLAAVHLGGKAWDFDTNDKLTSIGGVVGFGLRAAVTPHLALNITAEGYIYGFDPDTSDDTANGFFSNKTQTNLVVSIGIPINLSH